MWPACDSRLLVPQTSGCGGGEQQDSRRRQGIAAVSRGQYYTVYFRLRRHNSTELIDNTASGVEGVNKSVDIDLSPLGPLAQRIET